MTRLIMRVLSRVWVALLTIPPGIAMADIFDSPLADLVEAQQPGTWLRVNQNQFNSVWVPKSQTRGSSPRYVMSAWTGGGYDRNTGDFYIWGGDNGTYSGNEVYRFTAKSLSWERLSLPSNNTYTILPDGRKHWHTVDGTDNSPISGETFDNLTYLSGIKRFVVMGGNAYPGGGRQYFREDGVTLAGPFFFDPAKADPAKVGGVTGSNVNPTMFPNVVGGNMWENRQSIQKPGGPLLGPSGRGSVSASTVIDGKDVVFLGKGGGGGGGNLYKYTVNSLDASQDQWEVVGRSQRRTHGGEGAGAYDPVHNVFVRTGTTKFEYIDPLTGSTFLRSTYSLLYWDLNNAGPTNQIVHIHPDSLLGDDLLINKNFGLDYDPVTDAFYLWSGLGDVWKVTMPKVLGPTGWTVENVSPLNPGPTLLGSKFTGVYGKWNYMDGLGAFMGSVHDITGDVWVYKPEPSDFAFSEQELNQHFSSGFGEMDGGSPSLYTAPALVGPSQSVPLPGTGWLVVLGLFVLIARSEGAFPQARRKMNASPTWA